MIRSIIIFLLLPLFRTRSDSEMFSSMISMRLMICAQTDIIVPSIKIKASWLLFWRLLITIQNQQRHLHLQLWHFLRMNPIGSWWVNKRKFHVIKMSAEEKNMFKTDTSIKVLQLLYEMDQIQIEQSQNSVAVMQGAQKFVRALACLKSNPYHEEPLGEVESLEDCLAIENVNQVTDQIRLVSKKEKFKILLHRTKHCQTWLCHDFKWFSCNFNCRASLSTKPEHKQRDTNVFRYARGSKFMTPNSRMEKKTKT